MSNLIDKINPCLCNEEYCDCFRDKHIADMLAQKEREVKEKDDDEPGGRSICF